MVTVGVTVIAKFAVIVTVGLAISVKFAVKVGLSYG